MNQTELYYMMALSQVEGVAALLARNLIAYCGSAEAVFKSSKTKLGRVPGIGPATRDSILSFREFDKIKKELDFIAKHEIQVYTYYDSEYPARLRAIYNAPLFCFAKGNFSMQLGRVVAIVGTREPTVYGKHLGKQIVEELSESNCTIVSGLAHGIDATAHRHALEVGVPTIGILAHGLNRVYPSDHRKLSKEMQKNGGLITEFLTCTKPDRENFPKRNRIVAGLADAVVVIETPRRGGSIITAEYAWDFDRPIFTFPGRVADKKSEGCLQLIKDHKASLIESGSDLMEHMGWDIASKKPKQIQLFELSSDEQLIMKVLQHEKNLHIEQLEEKSGLNAGKLAYLLLELEFKKLVICRPGKIYEPI